MTVVRSPGSIEAAVLAALHGLSDREVEDWTGRGKSFWYKVSNPGKAERLSFADAAQLDAAALSRGEPARFSQLLSSLTATALQRQGGAPPIPSLEDGLRRLVIESGELAGALASAARDAKMTLAERRVVAAEAQHVIDAATRIRDTALAGGGA